MTVTFDSSAWIEYFSGSNLGLQVKDFVDGKQIIYTPVIDLHEIKAKYLREGHDWETRINFIIGRSLLVDIDAEIALLAADMRHQSHLHSMDALIYACARKMDSTVLTKDNHFRDLPKVIMLEEKENDEVQEDKENNNEED